MRRPQSFRGRTYSRDRRPAAERAKVIEAKVLEPAYDLVRGMHVRVDRREVVEVAEDAHPERKAFGGARARDEVVESPSSTHSANPRERRLVDDAHGIDCLLYTSDAADEL